MEPAAILARLARANAEFDARYPGEPRARQPVHTCYVGAHLFRADTARRWGAEALASMDRHAPDPATLARVLELPGTAADHALVHALVQDKLRTEPVEDLRVDLEDGYGRHPDADEDAVAVAAARAVAVAWQQGTLPAAWGIRIKPLTTELAARGARTLALFVGAALEAAGALPPGFRLTLPKACIPAQVEATVALLEALEQGHGLAPGSLRFELMIETPQGLLDAGGRATLPALLDAAGPRLLGVHLGTYDLTASHLVPARHQALDHPTCDFAKHLIKAACGGRGLFLCDGSNNQLPVGDVATVHASWRTSARTIRHSLRGGWYQGWDLHPGQLPVRYAVGIGALREGLAEAVTRLGAALAVAGGGAVEGAIQDDAATGQALLDTVLRARDAGALLPAEQAALGLTPADLAERSFLGALARRAGRGDAQ